MRYAFEKCPDKEFANFHFDSKLPEISDFGKTPAGSLKLKHALLEIPGVVKVHCRDCRLSVQRGGTYTWDEIKAPVVEVVRREMGVHEELEEVEAYR